MFAYCSREIAGSRYPLLGFGGFAPGMDWTAGARNPTQSPMWATDDGNTRDNPRSVSSISKCQLGFLVVHSVVVHSVKDMSTDQRLAIEDLLGRRLRDDERLSIRPISITKDAPPFNTSD
jgi:hypothetical protein